MPKAKVHKFKDAQNVTCYFSEGTELIPDTVWKVETIVNDEFVELGTVEVSGKFVSDEMNAHLSIKGYEPSDIAQKLAEKKFPNANQIVTTRIFS